MKLSGRLLAVLLPVVVVGILAATDQILPATSEYQAQIRIWLAARATGMVALVLLTVLVILGALLSHPSQPQWKSAKAIFPWHESMWVFVVAFIAVHVVSLVVDDYAGVGMAGALVPGMSEYRSAPVALGVISVYALAVTVITARYTKLLPKGLWLKLHRLSAAVLALAWFHGVLAGTDTAALRPVYWISAFSVVGAVAYRYWVVRATARRHQPATLPSGEVAPVPVSND
ncbi:MAG TPA: ferric reductase-like transmembrane domain-containing protein [Candidatus Limnocylindria bacterium]|nr:ferric reductase-like transmembrane domain-containing protein [Candidatus Limnocylindria bacterium]